MVALRMELYLCVFKTLQHHSTTKIELKLISSAVCLNIVNLKMHHHTAINSLFICFFNSNFAYVDLILKNRFKILSNVFFFFF